MFFWRPGIPFLDGFQPPFFKLVACGVLFAWKPRWWFQIYFIFTSTWGNDPIWLVFFRWGWNHQPVISCVASLAGCEFARHPSGVHEVYMFGIPFWRWGTSPFSSCWFLRSVMTLKCRVNMLHVDCCGWLILPFEKWAQSCWFYRMRQSIKLAFTTVGGPLFWGAGGDDIFCLDAAINVWNIYSPRISGTKHGGLPEPYI